MSQLDWGSYDSKSSSLPKPILAAPHEAGTHHAFIRKEFCQDKGVWFALEKLFFQCLDSSCINVRHSCNNNNSRTLAKPSPTIPPNGCSVGYQEGEARMGPSQPPPPHLHGDMGGAGHPPVVSPILGENSEQRGQWSGVIKELKLEQMKSWNYTNYSLRGTNNVSKLDLPATLTALKEDEEMQKKQLERENPYRKKS
ncbi:hypothetical protein SAY87_014450 [Trapa incisa]|uniref:Uncharacterized protein n=1 Tax=Trapa incisa TaxID=236973 RepID=A0AAN7JKD3_9MYRT|nr:hypothetical protein SAY87_014450 [Trapa incisa]